MPKVVDHAERRHAIVSAAWRLIAARGIDGINMRDLAAEAGYTNGALSRYFSGKDEILRTAFELVLEETNGRIDRAVANQRGLTALYKMCREIMPLTEEARLEARIAISLWQRAITDSTMELSNNTAVAQWRAQIALHLREAVEDGVLQSIAVSRYADLIMTTMIGLQVTAVLDRPGTSRKNQLALIDTIVDGCRAPVPPD
ncbi:MULTISPECIES: TetR/AcrR family transcriptional regulator [unclassified Rhodococcus (in: high G+C Gram-positive bacteria)]|uniref:TetR/AcrR family transcriptional regulator n=1 Tax=unclassified Rhodococcus (in: high G+C Gram-positive bacteria) TaxID=192944 RepID=UPI00096A4F7E|nr:MULTISPECIES: TetR/AcrR family transcriptional regulator [unclassified Rhodococcus (in: high G+C Gram-positive bacteria)]